jgi:PadR family transcriptional regulator PadR
MSENINIQMRKGVLEFCILSILKQHDAYTSEIIERLKDAQLIVVEGTLYPLLTRLKNDGVLSYRWEESPSGPPRKYYRITPEGEAVLADLLKSWNELVESVNLITQSQSK